MIKGAIFDVDGVILDSMSIWWNLAENYLNSIGIDSDENLTEIISDKTLTETVIYIKNKYNIAMSVAEILNEINGIVNDFYFNKVELKPGAKELLEHLKSRNIKITAATLSERNHIERAFERLDILKHFDKIFTVGEVGKGKNEPDIFYAARDFMGTQTEETAVFEDSVYAITTAKKAGFYCFGIKDESGKESQWELKVACDKYLKSIDEAIEMV